MATKIRPGAILPNAFPRLPPKEISFLVRPRRQRSATTGTFHCRTAKQRTTFANKPHSASTDKQEYPKNQPLATQGEKSKAAER